MKLKVGLALGGGAARGMAHVGVLRAFEREKLQIDVVSGTSMGAIIGGAYFALGDCDELEKRVRSLQYQMGKARRYKRLTESLRVKEAARARGEVRALKNLKDMV